MKLIFLSVIFTLSLYGCDIAKDVCTNPTVVWIGDCTNAAADAWDGYHPGSCRVQMSDGRRITAKRPVSMGDSIQHCIPQEQKE